MTQVAHAALPAPNVPDAIKAPSGNEPFLVGHATGVQIYTCNGAGSWGSAVPRAELVNDPNQPPIINHFAGPTWQELPAGSSVVGAKVNDGVKPDPNAIPWLLLKATKKTAGRGGNLLAPTTFIQRINTTGGLAPTDVCDASTTPKVREVPYTADYHFYKATKS
jgi:hypothetical protein